MVHWGHSFASNSLELRLLTPEGAEQSITLAARSDLKIGTATECDLRLDGAGIAPRHCRIFERNGRLHLIDHGSPAGTLINDQRCVQPTVLREGDRIVIGLYLLEVLPGRAHLATDIIAKQMSPGPHVLAGHDDFFVQRLDQEAKAWHERGRPGRLLLRGERLERAVRLPTTTSLDAWLRASAVRSRLRQGLRWLLAGLMPGLLLGGYLAAPVFSSAPPSPLQPTPLQVATPASLTPPPAPPTCMAIRHHVIPQETLEEIARFYDVDITRLATDNGLDPAQPLAAGTSLSLCAFRPARVRYPHRVRVGQGDTWESLARAHGLSVDKLRAYNPGISLAPGVLVDLWNDTPPPPVVPPARPDVPSGTKSTGKPTIGSINGVLTAISRHYKLRCVHTSYTSSHTATQLERAIVGLRTRHNYHGEIIVGDLSKRFGGSYGPHLSHQSGRDVDIWLPIQGGFYRQDEVRCKSCNTTWCRPKPEEVDWSTTLHLVQALLATGSVKNIFLDRRLHPALRQAALDAGLTKEEVDRLVQPGPGRPAAVTHAARHMQHLHVRFRCGPDEPGCYD